MNWSILFGVAVGFYLLGLLSRRAAPLKKKGGLPLASPLSSFPKKQKAVNPGFSTNRFLTDSVVGSESKIEVWRDERCRRFEFRGYVDDRDRDIDPRALAFFLVSQITKEVKK